MTSILPLAELLENVKEDEAKEILSSFRVSRNPDVQKFVTQEAISYEKSGNARSFFFMSESMEFLGFFALALNVVYIPDGVSKSLRKELTGYGRYSSKEVACYLVGQLARFDGIPKEALSGEDMFDAVYEQVSLARKSAGGRILAVDCEDGMTGYYEEKGFRKLNKVDRLNHMVMVL